MQIPVSRSYHMEDAQDNVEDPSIDQSMNSNRPTVGQLRLPAPVRHPPLPVVLYLDLLPSDGDATKWRVNVPKYTVEAPDVAHTARFLNNFCGRQDLQALCGGPFTIKLLPVGYQSMRSDRGLDVKIFGHPSGLPYKCMARFGVHIAFMMQEDLPNCNCGLCSSTKWRKSAPADAIIRVGLPRIPGGAVTAALAQSLARERTARALPVAQPPPIRPQLPLPQPTEPILDVDLSWTNYTRNELQKTLDFVRGLTASVEDIDVVVLVHITDNRTSWEPDLLNYLSYLDRPDAHTLELDGLWQQWLGRQLAVVEATKVQAKSAKAAQESFELLRRARDVSNLSQWQKDVVNQAMEYIAGQPENAAAA